MAPGAPGFDHVFAALVGRCRVFGDGRGEKVANFKRAWETAVLKAHGHTPERVSSNGLKPATRALLASIDLHFHDLRHECGSRPLEGGVPLHHVQAMLGHENLSQTSTYLNATRIRLHEIDAAV
jgi:integrase